MKTPAVLLPALLASGLLVACSGGGGDKAASAGDDRFAGLDQQIAQWRTELEASSPLCAAKVDGAGCESFQVNCKAERTITPEEQAKGVTAKLVAAMTFTGKGPDGRPGSSFAQFSRAGETWTRAEAPTLNLTTCAG